MPYERPRVTQSAALPPAPLTLTYSCPQISGASERASRPYGSGSAANCSISSRSAGVSTYDVYDFLCCVTVCASMNVSAMRPARIALKPVYGVGRKMPATVAKSPGEHERVSSPRKCTVMLRGMWPIGTSSVVSCRRIS